MSFVNFHVELQWLRPLFERLVTAVERIAGPLPEIREAPRMSTLDDYSFIPENEQARVQVENELFARKNMLVPGSEAFISAVSRYEQQILDSYGVVDGPLLIAQLPWKVQAGNPNA